ncbi:MAG: sulfatase [Planctomycetaceae bacterium]
MTAKTSSLLTAILPVLTCCCSLVFGEDSRPNFVFVITDDISPDDLSVYGNQVIRTPHLERMAQQGLVFDNACLTISSCSPSRCSIITGRYPHNTGAPELHTQLPDDQVTFVRQLRAAGYHTVISGKNHMAKAEQLGFETSSDSHPAGAENWVRHLQERPRDRPFFCWLAPHDAHAPFQFTDEAPVYSDEEISVPPMLFDGPGTRHDLAGHAHEVSRTDHYVGEVIQELKKQKLTESTYVIYCSDNGRPFPRCKTYLYDSGIRTPLIITGPGVATGRTTSLVSSIDFSATILDLAQTAIPATVQGISFRSILKDPQQTVRDVAFSERNWHVYQNHERSVRWKNWLYIRNAWPDRHNVSSESSNFRFPAAKELWEAAADGRLTAAQRLMTEVPQPPEMLFNVSTDPHQFENLIDDTGHQQVAAQMRQFLDTWTAETGDSVPESPTPDRDELHRESKKPFRRGEFPGATHDAQHINRPGPVRF